MIEEGTINVSWAIDEEGVMMHGLWLMWMVVEDEGGSERKTKELALF